MITKGDFIMKRLNMKDTFNEVIETIKRFQSGYSKRNLENIDAFMADLFIIGDSTYAVGTGTTEVFLDSEKVKELISGDWKYWGDVKLDYENAHISIKKETVWFSVEGSVNQSFEDSEERYNSYINFIKDKLHSTDISIKQKLTFINWVLALTFHQRKDEKREYRWPLRLSGILIRKNSKWKFSHINFSIPKPNYPDERFENDKSYIDSYNEQNNLLKEYKDETNSVIDGFLRSFEKDIKGTNNLSSLVRKYFTESDTPYFIDLDNKLYEGIEKIEQFLKENEGRNMSLEIDQYIVSSVEDVSWITATGKLNQHFSESEFMEMSLNEINNLFDSKLSSKDKIFAIQRNISYALKECTAGEVYTYPIRIFAVILNSKEGTKFNSIQISCPFSWIFEGKLDSI